MFNDDKTSAPTAINKKECNRKSQQSLDTFICLEEINYTPTLRLFLKIQ